MQVRVPSLHQRNSHSRWCWGSMPGSSPEDKNRLMPELKSRTISFYRKRYTACIFWTERVIPRTRGPGRNTGPCKCWLVSRLYGISRTYIRACTTVCAEFRINGVFVLTFADRSNRTLIDTGPTCNTFISDNICHGCSSPFPVSGMLGIQITMKWQVFFSRPDHGGSRPARGERPFPTLDRQRQDAYKE